MKCPHCEEEIAGSPCPECGAPTVFDEANYCMACGAPLKEGLKNTAQQEPDEDEAGFDLEDRVLCPDGTCTGIVIDGRCTECGRRVGADGQFIQEEETQELPADTVEDEAEAKKVDY